MNSPTLSQENREHSITVMASLEGTGYWISEPRWAIGRGYDYDTIIAVERLVASVQSQEEAVTPDTNTETMTQHPRDVLNDIPTRRESVLTHRQRVPHTYMSHTFLPGPTYNSHYDNHEFENGSEGIADSATSPAGVVGQRKLNVSQQLEELRNKVADSMKNIELVNHQCHSISESSLKASQQSNNPSDDSVQHDERLEDDGQNPNTSGAHTEAERAARVINGRIDKDIIQKKRHKRGRGGRGAQNIEKVSEALETSNPDTRAGHPAREGRVTIVSALKGRSAAVLDKVNQQHHNYSVPDAVTAGNPTIDIAHPTNHPDENKEKATVDSSTAKKKRPRPRKAERIATLLARQAIVDQRRRAAIPRDAREISRAVEATLHSWSYGDR